MIPKEVQEKIYDRGSGYRIRKQRQRAKSTYAGPVYGVHG